MQFPRDYSDAPCVAANLSVSYTRFYRSVGYACYEITSIRSRRPARRFFIDRLRPIYFAGSLHATGSPRRLDMLKSALQASRSDKQARHFPGSKAERERLEVRRNVLPGHMQTSVNGNLRRVHLDALEKLEKGLRRERAVRAESRHRDIWGRRRINQKRNWTALCRLAGEVPSLWHHPEVTNQERKEILRCVIDHVVIAASKQRIDATIFWKTGARTSLFVWRPLARHQLVRELHAKHLTLREIKEHLAAGTTSTGQLVKLSVGRISLILKKLGLKKHRHTAAYATLGQEAAQLSRDGRSFGWIAEHFNERGLESSPGKPWTNIKVRLMIRRIGEKAGSLESLHRSVIADARARGLDDEQTAVELNQKAIRRRNGRPWTADQCRDEMAGNLIRPKRNPFAEMQIRKQTYKEISMTMNAAAKQEQPPSFTHGCPPRSRCSDIRSRRSFSRFYLSSDSNATNL